ncbi:RraA family protein [Sphingobium boeckii]|uniref:Putative 4-hydroxy-4-methyl-2-oxoglutarate aldolase n=1 Tax=Sphingobium boeckii TaxID=1082345 RepID=A0A7W9AGE4_9SPHN|nr:RraA family protein [Sphingobium boeckii]MBB5684954.1 regulator of RNase E activity RraA [Sphingobium boeckii]
MYTVNPMPDPVDQIIISGLLETDTGSIGHFIDSGVMDPGIRGYMPGAKICGVAITVRVTVPDSVMGHYALKLARPGDVLVVDRGQDQRTACFGGSSILGVRRAGIAGLIMDGVGNDIAEANAAGVPIWCRGVTPLTTKYRNLGGAINVPVSCGGIAVQPGDIIFADDNGVLAIPRNEIAELLIKAKKFSEHEESSRKFFMDNPNKSLPELSGAAKIVEDYLSEAR